MLKEKINLQLFAEPTDPPQDPPTDPPAEQQDPPVESEKTFTQEEVDKIIDNRFARWSKEKEKAIQEAKEEAAKLAKMNADQKQQYELEKLQEENEKLKKAAVKVELEKTAAGLLRESDIEATPEVLAIVVGDDAEQTKANIDAFVKTVESQLKKAEVERATGTTPRSIDHSIDKMTEIEKRIAKYQ